MNIPKEQLSVLGKIIQFDQKNLDLLLEVFRESKPALFIDGLAEAASEKLKIGENEAQEIVRVLGSIYAARISLSHRVNFESFLKNICDALKAEKNVPPDADWQKFIKFVTDLLNQKGAIEYSSKALDVLLQNERNFITARIVTDFRPVFKENPADEPAGAVVVHQLKITYREDGEQKNIFFALDSSDIQTLKRVAERAVNKEASTLALASKLNLAVVRPEH